MIMIMIIITLEQGEATSTPTIHRQMYLLQSIIIIIIIPWMDGGGWPCVYFGGGLLRPNTELANKSPLLIWSKHKNWIELCGWGVWIIPNCIEHRKEVYVNNNHGIGFLTNPTKFIIGLPSNYLMHFNISAFYLWTIFHICIYCSKSVNNIFSHNPLK